MNDKTESLLAGHEASPELLAFCIAYILVRENDNRWEGSHDRLSQAKAD